VLPGEVVREVFWANVIAKGVITIVSIPWIYMVKPAPLEEIYPGPGG
jgi:hypothetical protein